MDNQFHQPVQVNDWHPHLANMKGLADYDFVVERKFASDQENPCLGDRLLGS